MASERRLLIFAGPNGSGKSTLTTPNTLQHFGIATDRYINADEIAQRLKVEMPDIATEEQERVAFRQARLYREEFRLHGISFAFETVFSHPSTLLDMQKCRAAEFEIVVLFVTTKHSAINIARVANRVRSGGHNVPEDRIRNRYERSMSLLPRIVEDANHAYVYDNSDETPQVFAFQGDFIFDTDPLPAYLEQRLKTPLIQRQAERDRVAKQFGTTNPPEIESGQYSGEICLAGNGYVVQRTPDELVLHDRLLFDGHTAKGDIRTITYKDGMGRIKD